MHKITRKDLQGKFVITTNQDVYEIYQAGMKRFYVTSQSGIDTLDNNLTFTSITKAIAWIKSQVVASNVQAEAAQVN